jgi:hypothetical protein
MHRRYFNQTKSYQKTMSEEQKEKKPTWLAKEFPTEWYFTEKFVDKLFHILDKMPKDTLLNFREMPMIFSKSTKGNESDGNSAASWRLIQISWRYSELWPQRFRKLCPKF